MINVTDIRIKPVYSSIDRLRAFCSITIDHSFVIRDLKIIEGDNGLFVAMPNRKRMLNCPNCSHKNQIQARYCNFCGKSIDYPKAVESETNYYLDIVHPLTTECRDSLQEQIIDAFQKITNNSDSVETSIET
ncbi:MAG: SpoVG family protein [Planctomycetia bacterium]|nr:SpoVG family protein [Planctomycetia bacterium]